MNTFKRKSLYLALVAGGIGAVGMTGSASAVNVNSNGLGQVLIYPYYTARNGTDTYVSVTNTTASAKAVKVRFTEGRNSREVLDFNLYLSANDVWTGAVVATASGAKLITADKSCTAPAIPTSTGQDFVNYAYAGATLVTGIVQSGFDGDDISLDRTREGYFEIIEMGVITNATIAGYVTHNSAGVPANCAAVQASTMDMGASATALNRVAAPGGGLAGGASLVRVAAGMDMSYDAVALAAFNDGSTNIWNLPGSISPDLRNANPARSVVFKGGSGVVTNWTGGMVNADAVTAVLNHNRLINEFVLDTTTLSQTDWVITMPTKRYYVPVAAATAATATAPFVQAFKGGTGACESITVTTYDREEQTVTSPGGFSPPAPGAAGTSLCWETTVMTFNAGTGATSSALLGSKNFVNLNTTYQNGWVNMVFAQTVTSPLAVAGTNLPAAVVHTYTGLPSVGFMVQDFVNGNVGGVLSNYGGNFNHKFTTKISGGIANPDAD